MFHGSRDRLFPALRGRRRSLRAVRARNNVHFFPHTRIFADSPPPLPGRRVPGRRVPVSGEHARRRGGRGRPRPAPACGLRAGGRLPGLPQHGRLGAGPREGVRAWVGSTVWNWVSRRAPIAASLPRCLSEREAPEPLRWVWVEVALRGCSNLKWRLCCTFFLSL